ncbi:MAG: elongation factor 4 [Candidatus Tagabacteria bacterium CG_4_10_14_0_2_um_filter_40_13]|uniref:Elongation factor 4 n=2 Tax=Candidatus Tagaibacteriota TaxID=1817918 RepID=A0A2M7B8Y6_9BACT|nr:MAG: elongation factor 4 [Candidatus Tagabacteria bacterium CG11_big_fil_rev_8_21_14_0_20_41_11]PIU99575.1 MAG: elongation factor 4 [Candidatus Tagabacteria bacterium CG03_land_8_20_14_0_80_41_22]PIZ56526.1 MAG: elongation factor 4 [Candidatus Tagabacteria bacterium CG_4_10_14_0_2_um_filter_40_13]PJC25307.1 MAG: elongation factor 4 [Candidatus Tagabacteria bacterium CG_4_9_14_0_2_um_filter_41_11]
MNEKELQHSIRNFSIIAHINHGKSTLADRFLEFTGAVEKRKMREQFLDQMDLERERGITIKMQPVRMNYALNSTSYSLNLIDTPGHIDFSYEVSRALKAVEGTVLLVDASQGVQAQTFANAELAKSLGLVIIPVLNKIDLPTARIDETRKEIMELLRCKQEEILEVSAKTGEGVERLLEEIIKRVPPPAKSEIIFPQALIFDFSYSPHKGVVAYIRLMKGRIKKRDELFLSQVKEKFIAHEVGFFRPELQEEETLEEGEIGYVATNIKKPAIVRVGDTVISLKNQLPSLSGYEESKPVVWASIYPESQDDFKLLAQSLERLHLSDSALSFEEEGSGVLGRGFKCGFLGMLHLEIVIERLKREFNLKLVTAAPSVVYEVHYKNGQKEEIYSPSRFPEENRIEKVFEPWIEAKIITPTEGLAAILKILQKHEAEVGNVEQFGSHRICLNIKMALREFMRNFFDELKSASEGYASLSYRITGMVEADVARVDILVAGEYVPAFARVIKRSQVQTEAKELVEKLKALLPAALFVIKIQAQYRGRIIASQTLSALKKDVTGYLYGGDRTRKMKLWKKQKAGKKRLKERGMVHVPHEVFLKMIKPEN